MDPNFWHRKWTNREIGFHRADVNPLLRAHLPRLGLAPGARLFLPLCGKTLDIGWLADQGFRVAGAELHAAAVAELFAELGHTPEITSHGPLERHRAGDVEIFVGDLFDLSRELLGPVDAVYDRAALVALPAEMRARYVPHLAELTDGAPQLLITYDYDQNAAAGPPFAVPAREVEARYADTYEITALASAEVPGGLKGLTAATESVWLLRKK